MRDDRVGDGPHPGGVRLEGRWALARTPGSALWSPGHPRPGVVGWVSAGWRGHTHGLGGPGGSLPRRSIAFLPESAASPGVRAVGDAGSADTGEGETGQRALHHLAGCRDCDPRRERHA